MEWFASKPNFLWRNKGGLMQEDINGYRGSSQKIEEITKGAQ